MCDNTWYWYRSHADTGIGIIICSIGIRIGMNHQPGIGIGMVVSVEH